MAKRQGATESKPALSAEQKALSNALSQIEKTFGAGAIMKLGEGSHMEVEGVSDGCPLARSGGGGRSRLRGRMVELSARRSSGKASDRPACRGRGPAWRTAWRLSSTPSTRLDPASVQAGSVSTSRPSSPSASPEPRKRPCRSPRMLVLSNAVDIVVIDSVAALEPPKAELEGEIGDTFVGIQARLMSQALRKLTGGVARSKCVLDLHQPDPRRRSA